MNRILLDTSILIDFSRRSDKVNTTLYKLQYSGYQLCISILTHAEIYSGKSIWEKNEVKKEAEDLFSVMEILPLEVELSKIAGEIKAHFGGTLVDSVIAATAIKHKLKLATLNIKDFKKIKGLKIAKIPKMPVAN